MYLSTGNSPARGLLFPVIRWSRLPWRLSVGKKNQKTKMLKKVFFKILLITSVTGNLVRNT